MNRVSTNLTRIRKARGFSMRGLARRSKVSAATISNVERGITPEPRYSTVARLADVLQIETHELYK